MKERSRQSNISALSDGPLDYASDYTHALFLQHMVIESIDVVMEVGSRDGRDAIALRDALRAQVYAFECHPESIRQCRANLAGQRGIRLIPKAVWDRTTSLAFHPVVRTCDEEGREIENNVGASSCFVARTDYRQRYSQEQITVEAITLEEFCKRESIESIDLLCIDVQGAALQVLKGIGRRLETVSYIIVELERKPIYRGQALFPEVAGYLESRGFEVIEEQYCDPWFSNYMFRAQLAPRRSLAGRLRAQLAVRFPQIDRILSTVLAGAGDYRRARWNWPKS